MSQKTISCFIPMGNESDLQQNLDALTTCSTIQEIFILGNPQNTTFSLPQNACFAEIEGFQQTQNLKALSKLIHSDYVMLYTQTLPLNLGYFALERMLQVAENTGAGMIYSDHFKEKDQKLQPTPLIDYQEGSLRDDFNFGSVLLFPAEVFKQALSNIQQMHEYAALYQLRLKISQTHRIFRIPEFLYTEKETDTRSSGEKIFDYVDPKNREVQIEMEKACTQHLKEIEAFLKPSFRKVDFSLQTFPVEASVIIPVRNRIKTIKDAVASVLKQKTSFPFNCIIVDNHSTDGTHPLLQEMAAKDPRLIHVVPVRQDLGIGGCWNQGVHHPQCGKFAIQLDSDDLYINESVIQSIVDAFYDQNCAMVVGSYQMVNFNLEEIPPGLIDHKEWTPDNGRNNALRINGLGAPRAFYTPIIRQIKVPNVSYGEDYALALQISRHYQIGRIYHPLYLCRRWEDNTDAALDIKKMNEHNMYKDRIRTIELYARQKMNQNI